MHECPGALSVIKANTWACTSHETCLEKEDKSDICHNVNEPGRHCANGYKLATKDKHDSMSLTHSTTNMPGSRLHIVLRVIKIMETEGSIVVSSYRERGGVELQFNRCRVSELGCKLNERFQCY